MPHDFSQLEPDRSWAFAWCSSRETGYITHCYHRYPAKFIPQVAARLIQEHSEPGAVVLDPFMGSGTTVVEALVAGRRARGTDVNPAALIASRAKVSAISPTTLRAALQDFDDRIAWLGDESRGKSLFPLPEPLLPDNEERLDWWFPKTQQRSLGIILAAIESAANPAVRHFLRCAFSHCLKSASYWLMKSSKPTRDKRKLARGVRNVLPTLRRHLAKMERANADFWRLLPQASKSRRKAVVDLRIGDARRLPWRPETVDLVVTSPPYVTSYEYADLHQLTSLWLGHLDGLEVDKQRFIGSAAARRGAEAQANSPTAARIVTRLAERSTSKADEVRQYFLDIEAAFAQMHRVLRPGGAVCNVIGNTSLIRVKILNAEVHAEILESLGFEIAQVIRRIIPLKTLPQIRDPKTGKFTSATRGTVQAYPEEFILIARKN